MLLNEKEEDVISCLRNLVVRFNSSTKTITELLSELTSVKERLNKEYIKRMVHQINIYGGNEAMGLPLNELKEEYTRVLDNLLYYLQDNMENTDLSESELFGYQMAKSDVKEYFEERLGVSLD